MKALLLCVFLCLVGCEWANRDSDGDGVPNAEEAARAAEAAGKMGGILWPIAGVGGAVVALVLRSMLKDKKEEETS